MLFFDVGDESCVVSAGQPDALDRKWTLQRIELDEETTGLTRRLPGVTLEDE